jgi:hypothetical protein
MARSPRSGDDLKAGIKTSIPDIMQQHRRHNDEVEGDQTAASFALSDHLRSDSTADQLVHTCNTTAAKIQGAGEAVIQVANNIAAETQALAELLRQHGATINSRIEEFTTMSKRVAETMQAARDDAIGTSRTGASLAPKSDHVNTRRRQDTDPSVPRQSSKD